MKILHTADWHLGTFRSPVKDGVNLRTEDTKRCLNEMIRVAGEERPDYSLVSGDIFHSGKTWSDRCCEEIVTATHYIKELAAVSKQVVVMRGTPNHDGIGLFNVLAQTFEPFPNVHIVITPQVIPFEDADIALIPGFDRGIFRANHPGISADEENLVFTEELSNIVTGLKAQCSLEKKSILMAHYTIPGCNTESGQTMMLTQFEPVIPQEALLAANYDLVALGHIHRPQKIHNRNWYYSGAINALNFNDEGQERGFWIHNWHELGTWQSIFHKTPYRGFATIKLDEDDVTQINMQALDFVATQKWRGEIDDKIVRVHYSCSAENSKALNTAVLEKELLDDGAFMVWEILPDKIDEFANRTQLENTTDPEANLIKYLEEKQFPQDKIQELVLKARPIIAEAEASNSKTANSGAFEPVEIAVKNYRNYEEETFTKYGKAYQSFKDDLFADKANAITLDFELDQDIQINGRVHLELKVKSNTNRGLISAQVLEMGDKKYLAPIPALKRMNLDNGRLFKEEALRELPFKQAKYRVITKGHLNLQNRKDLLTIENVTPNEWMTIGLDLQPTIYKLNKGDKLRLVLYTTDFEHTIRDNSDYELTVDLSQSQMTLPY